MAIAPVVIDFLAKGMPQVQQAFQSIQVAAVKAAKAQQVAAERSDAAIQRSADRRARDQVAAWKKIDRFAEQAHAKAVRDTERAAKAEAREIERGAKAKIAAMQKADRWADQARARAVKETERAAKTEARAVEMAERAKTRAAEREAKAKIAVMKATDRAVAQAHAAAQRDIVRAERDAKRQRDLIKGGISHKYNASRAGQAERDLNKWQSANAPDPEPPAPKLPKNHRNSSALGRVVESVVGAGARGVIAGLDRSANVAMGLAGTAAQLGGGFSIADSVMGEQNLRKKASVLSASTLLAGNHATRRIGTDEIVKRAKAIGIEQNIDPSEVLTGFDKVKKLTGDLNKAMDVMPMVAKLSTASGSDIGDVSGLAANILAANPKISSEDLYKQLRLFTRQGVVGGVELEDFAKYGSRITAGATYFGGNKETNEATLGAMAQMSRQYGGANSAAEATLGAQRFATDVAKHAGDLKKDLGIDVSDGHGNLKDAQQIILEMLSKTGGDLTKFSQTRLGERGVKPLLGTAAIYKNAGGGEAGLAAVRREFEGYTTGTSKEEVDAANARVMAEQGFERSMLELRLTAGQELLPVFKEMIPVVRDMLVLFTDVAKIAIPAFTEAMKAVKNFAKEYDWLIKDVASNPIGSLIAFEVTKSFAAAGLPALLRGLFAGAFGGGLPVPGAPGGVGGAGAPGAPPIPPGGGLAVLAGGVIQAGAAWDLYDTVRKAQSVGDRRADEVSQMDPDTVAFEVARAKKATGGGETFSAWADVAMRGANIAASSGNLGGIAGSYLGDLIGEALAGKSTLDKSTETIASNRMIDVLERIANNTAAGGGSGGNSGSGGAGRKDSIVER